MIVVQDVISVTYSNIRNLPAVTRTAPKPDFFHVDLFPQLQLSGSFGIATIFSTGIVLESTCYFIKLAFIVACESTRKKAVAPV